MDLERHVVEEVGKYRRAWADPAYRIKAHGLTLWKRNREIFPHRFEPAIDVGCGHGRLMAHWLEEGRDAWGLDLVDGLDEEVREAFGHRFIKQPIWEMTGRYRLGVAADVLEHIHPSMVEASLRAIGTCCEVFVCQNAEFPSVHGSGTLHLTMRPVEWWREQMGRISGKTRERHVACGRGRHVIEWVP